MTQTALSSADLTLLLTDPSTEHRIETMSKLVQDLASGALNDVERSLALEVLHCFADDAEVAVREAVAWQLHNSLLLTDDLAARLVKDVARVAFPILRHAGNLREDLLLEVLADPDAGKHLAIAGRKTVSARVADAVVEAGNVAVVTCLLRNGGAEIRERSLHRALDRFGRIRIVSDAAAARSELPLAVAERLVAFVSEGMRQMLTRSHGLAPELVERLVAHGREAATLRLLRPVLRGDQDIDGMVRWLSANGRLTPALLFRALCAGDLELVIAGLAVRAVIPVENARRLAWDDGPLGLDALLGKADMAPYLRKPFRTAFAVVKRLGYHGGEEGRDEYQSEVIAEVYAACTPTSSWDVDDLLLQLFDQKSDAVIDNALDRAGLPFAPARPLLA
ncbi:MAG TPA: DUF2336 domain-containing protein [Azospirillum sp.]|nr:DUF2336 domain-containing protein [Azospirillum sp.]